MGATRQASPARPVAYPVRNTRVRQRHGGGALLAAIRATDLRPSAACRRIGVDRMCAGGRSWPVGRTAPESRRVDGPRLPEGAIWESSAIGITSVGRAAGWVGLRARSLPRTSLC